MIYVFAIVGWLCLAGFFAGAIGTMLAHASAEWPPLER